MKTNIGQKVTTPMPDGLAWPALVLTEPEITKHTVIDRNTGQPVVIDISRVTVLSQRTNRVTGEPYPAVTSEVVNYGYRAVMTPRFSNILGLDVTEEGALIPLADAVAAYEVAHAAWQREQFDARKGATSVDAL